LPDNGKRPRSGKNTSKVGDDHERKGCFRSLAAMTRSATPLSPSWELTYFDDVTTLLITDVVLDDILLTSLRAGPPISPFKVSRIIPLTWCYEKLIPRSV
jgi:hypothetical protein